MIAAALLATLPGLALQAEPSGNVLILVADDLGLDQLGLYGWPDAAPTPNLAALAAGGVLFWNAWAHPTCSPTRATLQTGRHAFRTGIGAVIPAHAGGPGLPLDEVTLPELLDLGTGGAYAHAAIGKWHLGTSQVGGDLAPNQAGYAHFAGSLEGQIERYDHWRRVEDGVAAYTSRYATSVCVDDALTWIHAQTRPWLCVVSFQAPHAPFHRPPAGLHTQALPAADPRENCGDAGGDPRPFMRAAVQALDTEIGRLLAGLPSGQREGTTVFFLGDNGSESCIARPPTTNRAKGTLYESGVRVPFLAAGRGVTARGTSTALVGVIDLFATVAELAGIDLAATLPGHVLDSVSLVPCLADRTARVRSHLYAEAFAPIGPGTPQLLPPCPPGGLCQPSLGLDGPGAAVLTACGPPLYGRGGIHEVAWQLSGAPPDAPAWLLIGPFTPAWVPQLGAVLASSVPERVLAYRTGPDGTLARTLWTASGASQRHYQMVVADPAQPRGYAVTDALRMHFLASDQRAVRGTRYKLIRQDPCHEELYDLALDPYEQTNLLAAPLTPAARAAHDGLSAILMALR
ncbi:MAG TPA: sulfatase-like hydrolase/transferase [Planctomycetota bacterium]